MKCQKYIARCYRVYQHERNENASFLSIFNGGGRPKWRFSNFPRFWKNSSALGSFNCIFENNSLKALFGQIIWRKWKFWNCRWIFDIYRNWLLKSKESLIKMLHGRSVFRWIKQLCSFKKNMFSYSALFEFLVMEIWNFCLALALFHLLWINNLLNNFRAQLVPNCHLVQYLWIFV